MRAWIHYLITLLLLLLGMSHLSVNIALVSLCLQKVSELINGQATDHVYTCITEGGPATIVRVLFEEEHLVTLFLC